MAPKTPKVTANTPSAPVLPSIDEMKARVAAHELAEKVRIEAEKLANKKPVGRPGRKGTIKRSYHILEEDVEALEALKTVTRKSFDELVSEGIQMVFSSNPRAIAKRNA